MTDEFSGLEENCRLVQINGNFVYGEPDKILSMIYEIRRLRGILDNVRVVDRFHAEDEYNQEMKSQACKERGHGK